MDSVVCALVAFAMGAFFCLISVALGAFCVYRTKREPHEPFFGFGKSGGDVLYSDDIGAPETYERSHYQTSRSSGDDLPEPDVVNRQNARFLQQMLAEEAVRKVAKEQSL